MSLDPKSVFISKLYRAFSEHLADKIMSQFNRLNAVYSFDDYGLLEVHIPGGALLASALANNANSVFIDFKYDLKELEKIQNFEE